MEPHALLTVQEAAARIGVPEIVINRATLGGKLPFVRKSGRNLIETAQLCAYQIRAQLNGENPYGNTKAAA